MDAPAQLPRSRRITRIRGWSQTPSSEEPPPSVAAAVEETPAPAPVDLAPCSDCLRELMDPQNRRYRYPFINCEQCGPRFTIVRALPYDREQTTMARFKMCVACRREHDDPADRRFHATSSACPACGPRLQLVVAGRPQATGELALGAAVAALRAGQIVALKGVGGFVLACDATRGDVVARLRARKRRSDKPLAVMARALVELERLVHLDDTEREALRSAARPIVVARTRPGSEVAPGVAAGFPELGVFLPATPLHHLLLSDGPALQVMTSGNAADEAPARDDREALTRLAGIADVFLLHGRKIHAPVEDSVVRVIAGEVTTVRRARGFVPAAFTMPVSGASVLAVGTEHMSTICLTRGNEAILSQHLGELGDAETYRRFEETIAKMIMLTGTAPVAVAHDLGADLRPTRWAQRAGLRLHPVQHHHAHLAACLVEHGRSGPVLAVAFDGDGAGPDGTSWGGEFLLGDLGRYQRLGHLRPIRLPSGEPASHAQSPWRLAASVLFDAGEPTNLVAHAGLAALAAVHDSWRRGTGGFATGAARWFDAVSALCGVRREVSYEGQAAGELEAIAAPGDHAGYDFWIEQRPDSPFVIDLRPTVRDIAYGLRVGTAASTVSARFHRTLAQAIATACRYARDAGAPNTVVLTGSCFQNRLLTELTLAELLPSGFEVLRHRRVPANDGGLALGQAAIAAYQRAMAVATIA